MASIYKRKNNDETTVWRAIIRIKGYYPTVCNHFDRKQEADDWAKKTKQKIKVGQFNFSQYKKQYTFQELVERFLQDGALEHHCSADDTRRHLSYWNDRLGRYSLIHITPELLGKERQILADTPTPKNLYQKRRPQKALVFASKTAFGRVDIKKAWQQALKRADIQNCRFHDMRHTFCTYAAAKEASNLQL